MAEVNVLDPDRDAIVLVTVDWDLPEASQQLISVGKTSRTVVPAYVVGDGQGTGRPVAPAEACDDLNLTSVVVGLEDPSSVASGRLTAARGRWNRNGPTSRLFQEIALTKGAYTSLISPDTAAPFEMEMCHLFSQWADWLADLPQPADKVGAAAAGRTHGSLPDLWPVRLTQSDARQPSDERAPGRFVVSR